MTGGGYAAQAVALSQHTDNGTAIVDGYASSGGLVPDPSAIVAVILVAVAAAFFTSNYRRFKVLRRALAWIGTSGRYFLQGVGALAVLAVLSIPVYLFADAPVEAQGQVLRYAGIGLGVYLAIAGIGYVADKLYQRARSHNQRLQAEPSDAEPAADGGDPDDVTF